MPREQKAKGRYRQKQESGMVPHRYERDSKKHQMGAWKWWGDRPDLMEYRGLHKADVQVLMNRETRYHRFVKP